MDGSLNEAERPQQSPVTADQPRPVALSVVIDGRLDPARARQVGTLADRLGLAGISERVRLLGGAVEIEARAGNGVVVRATLPRWRPVVERAPSGLYAVTA